VHAFSGNQKYSSRLRPELKIHLFIHSLLRQSSTTQK